MAQMLAIFLALLPAMTQAPRMPDVVTQRAAMKKLDFLVGEWSGTARIYRSGAEPLELQQSEKAQFKLEGLLLEIEGVGRTKDGKPALQALGIVSYDEDRQTYHFRAFNDGRWLESDTTLTDDRKGIKWGFKLGDIQTSSLMRIAATGNWTEEHEIIVGSQPTRKLMEVNVSRIAPR